MPNVTVNGISKRGKRGQPKDNESGDSDKDATNNMNNTNHSNNTNGIAAGSDADIAATTDNNGNGNGNNTLHFSHTGKKKEPSMNELKRRAAAMLDWVEKAKEDLGKSSVVGLTATTTASPSPASPPDGPPPPLPVKSELGSVAELLHNRLLGWQVEYGAG
jgi:hypothetical protein